MPCPRNINEASQPIKKNTAGKKRLCAIFLLITRVKCQQHADNAQGDGAQDALVTDCCSIYGNGSERRNICLHKT